MKWLCKLGKHAWKRTDGDMVTRGDAVAIFFTRTCIHCGKREDRVMSMNNVKGR